MNEEIKEIVVDNGELIAYYKDGSFQAFDTLLQEVLDYITNLQEEVNILTAESTEWESKCYDLQEKNIKLKELCDKYEEEHSTTFQIWKYNKDTYKEENERLNNIIDELEKWLNEYYESNRKWYNTELSNHDRKYYEREYRNTEFMIVKFKKQLNELKGDNK